MQTSNNRELWLSFFAILLITLAYLFMVSMVNGIPRASDFFGHSIGILGFILMLMTETLYSIRKRKRNARWGRMSSWLNFHIFTGLVGPYLVLLHSSWKFNGLAGIVMLLTMSIVASGFIGRYLYTSIPRTADGIAVEESMLDEAIAHANLEMQTWLENQPENLKRLAYSMADREIESQGKILAIYTSRIRERKMLKYLDAHTRKQIHQMESLIKHRRLLGRQRRSLVVARRMLALWHAIHIPIGMVLFIAAFIHIGAAIYYATLLR